MENFLTRLFPEAGNIPADVQVPYTEQREYLINGELREWKGDLSPVLSPVFVRRPDGTQEQQVIGKTP